MASHVFCPFLNPMKPPSGRPGWLKRRP